MLTIYIESKDSEHTEIIAEENTYITSEDKIYFISTKDYILTFLKLEFSKNHYDRIP